jgi:CheY-like chemotaxis protein
VDDNEFNQKVASLKLRKMGHSVEVAGSGGAALAALEKRRFDLVFMDMQMPDMDGLEVTARIREKEKSTGQRVPIVAMTAHALDGVRERCFAAGMDGYLGKPIQDAELRRVIEETGPARRIQPETVEAAPALCAGERFDTATVLERVGGNLAILRELMGIFRTDSFRLVADLQAALQEEDEEKLSTTAHTLKGMVSFFEAREAVDAALVLETKNRTSKSAAVGAVEVLVEEIGRIQTVFGGLCEEETHENSGCR